jgi:UDP-N-acetylmuramoyl-tripeptide--D-alanyl-D-alanine ligase
MLANIPLWRIEEIQKAVAGTLHGQVNASLNGVSIDSRSIAPGDIFVAIKGETHDGHQFVARALQAGAGLAIVDHATADMIAAGPVLETYADPLRALEKMAVAARARSRAQIIAVTGSVGKTSTKEMLRGALSASGKTHVSAASFNNHWGVPLTLARLPADAAYGVFEIGMNHAGEITPLVAMVRPHVAIITSIAASHLGHFNSLDGIAAAKAEIFSGVVTGGHAVINQDSPYFSFLAEQAQRFGVTSITGFGEASTALVSLQKVALQPDCSCVSANILGSDTTYKLGTPGTHMVMNSLAVLGAAKLVGADLARASLALSDAKPAKGRGVQQMLKAGDGQIMLLDESYNANPASVRAALALLKQLQPQRRGRRIAVLGDMLELGEFAPKLHAELADEAVRHGTDLVFACGASMAHLWNALPLAKRGAYALTSTELAAPMLGELRGGDVVMIKGSLGSKMGLLAERLRERYPPINKGDT